MGRDIHPDERAWRREGLILGSFLLVCGLSLWLVVVPELSDHARERGDAPEDSAADAGLE